MSAPELVEIVAADPVLRAGVESTVRACPEMRVATSGAAVAVVAVDAVDADAIGAIRAVPADRRGIVLLATTIDVSDAVRAIEAGVSGVLRRREASPPRLLSTIRVVAGGAATMPPDLLDALFKQATTSETTAILDDREKAVLRMLGEGHETEEIARSLAYSQRTVTAIVHAVTRRLRLRNRAHAVAFALKAGLI